MSMLLKLKTLNFKYYQKEVVLMEILNHIKEKTNEYNRKILKFK